MSQCFFADKWEAYAELIPREFLVQTEAGLMGWSGIILDKGAGLVVFAERPA